MNTKLYIGTDLADFNEAFNVMFSIGDIREMGFGNSNKSYTLNLPLTKQNKKLLKFISQADVKSEPSATARLYLGEMLVISGRIEVKSYTEYSTAIIINSDDWIDDLKDIKMTDLDLSASDHDLTHDNVKNSWSASYPVYRYPMIDFGGLQSGETGSSAKWYPTDFIPAIRIVDLIEAILSPYTISSTWLASSFVKDLFILGHEVIADEKFTKSRALQANCSGEAGNADTVNVAASATDTAELTDHVILFSNVLTDEGSDYTGSAGEYTVPETGTYRIYATVIVRRNGNIAPFTETNGNMTLTMKQTGSASRTLDTVSAASIVNNSSHVLDSGYVYLVASDVITVQTTMYSTATNGGGVAADLTVDIEGTSEFKLIWGNANRYNGKNKTISLEEMLPDITQNEFLALIRDMFNLRFWMDKMKRTIYIEPWDSFVTTTVIDLTSLVDFESIQTELISQNYYKEISLKWKDDEDEAYKEYMKYHAVSYQQKDITLSGLYTKKGIEIKEHKFSSVVEGPCYPISLGSPELPRIFNVFPVNPYLMFDRKPDFNTRIVEWKGLTAGFTWYYGAETHTSYPKIAGVDWDYLHDNYWLKLLHYIDKGKLYTVRIKATECFLNQFYTVISDPLDEGFRPIYKITINGSDNYFFLQKIVTDGNIAELELVLKQ